MMEWKAGSDWGGVGGTSNTNPREIDVDINAFVDNHCRSGESFIRLCRRYPYFGTNHNLITSGRSLRSVVFMAFLWILFCRKCEDRNRKEVPVIGSQIRALFVAELHLRHVWDHYCCQLCVHSSDLFGERTRRIASENHYLQGNNNNDHDHLGFI